MENLKNEILKLLEKLEADEIDYDYETELIRKLQNHLIEDVQLRIANINSELISDLTGKQKDFYKDIHAQLNKWIEEKAPVYLQCDDEDRNFPSKEEIKIAIREIGRLLTSKLNKKTFSDLVFKFKNITDNTLYIFSKSDLRDDFSYNF